MGTDPWGLDRGAWFCLAWDGPWGSGGARGEVKAETKHSGLGSVWAWPGLSLQHQSQGPRRPRARARPWAFPEQLQIGKNKSTGIVWPSRNGKRTGRSKAKVKRRWKNTGLEMGAPAGSPQIGLRAHRLPWCPGAWVRPATPPAHHPQSCSSAPCLLGPASLQCKPSRWEAVTDTVSPSPLQAHGRFPLGWLPS